MSSYKKLLNNSIIFAVGSLGSKLITFVLVPLYTFYLTTAEYGTVDLITTTITMLVPIVSASLYESLLRYIMDKEYDNETIFTNTVILSVLGFVICIFLFPILSFFNVFSGQIIYIYIILFVQIFEKILTQYARAIGKIKLFAINGILLTFSTAVFNVLFLVFFGWGVEGYLLAIILSNILSINFLAITTKAMKSFNFTLINKSLSILLIKFSVPMIPNSVMWWLINASSRYFITYFVGIQANGLFAVSSRIPALVKIFNEIFTQAWQLSAIEEYVENKDSSFYTIIFQNISSIMFIGSSLVLIILKPLFENLFSVEYYDAWKVVPFLLLGAVFSSFSSFLGANYLAVKKTGGILRTSIYGGVISIILNIVLINIFGTIGAGISSMVSFFIIFILRYFDSKKYINIRIKWSAITSSAILFFIQTTVLFLIDNYIIETLLQLIIVFVLFIFHREFFLLIYQLIKKMKRKT
jgi:O-antigen/teichoic acid export membrane protein